MVKCIETKPYRLSVSEAAFVERKSEFGQKIV
jgi:hypothetical protein